MRIVPFQGRSRDRVGLAPQDAWITELERALSGESIGPDAESWRALRGDVRALAPPMSADFEGMLGERILECQSGRQHRRAHLRRRGRQETWRPRTTPQGSAHVVGGAVSSGPLPDSSSARSASRLPRTLGRTGLGRLRALSPSTRLGLATLGTVAAALVVTLVIVGPLRSGNSLDASIAREVLHNPVTLPAISAGPAQRHKGAASSGSSSSAGAVDAPSAAAVPLVPGPAGASSTPGRLQQLAASITLTAASKDVQATADRVGQLAASDGGFVQSSQVQVLQGSGEATLTLRLPSTRLGADLASLATLAPVRAERQSLQDITDAYDSARRQAADATAERQALLRALARASTQGQIESLHARLSQNAAAVSRAHSTQRSVSRQAATATVEVTVLGDAHSASDGLSLHGGLRDASRVLIVVAGVLLIGAAVLVPLGLLLAALLAARRTWLRSRRDRALDAR